ncbi:phage baseplate protein [Roseibium alexandrii]|uniref:Dit-like phage tail protein N-terminal domain-containing protein n=1 Tax=Roseibium alexandrii TaxID=388408 RepID=A0A0M6ZXW1_9HYPH|nr:hypothetical protein [Roseibium alexandrii]CTQ67111.1 hypothetical protein LAX5112_01217 [Roseibium alexandrii]
MSVIAFSKSIGPVEVDCLISEKHTSELEITGNPIESGAEANDHAYVKPKEVVLEIADENASATFQELIRFQEKREPFSLNTGLSTYKNMLVQSVQAKRDARHSKILSATVTLKEVKIVGSSGFGVGGLGGFGGLSGLPSLGGLGSLTGLGNLGNFGGLLDGVPGLGAAPLTPSNVASDIINKASPVVHIGDSMTTVVPEAENLSIAKRIFG